jgi:hypothetical protein
MFENAPCRSCGNWKEVKVQMHLDSLGGSIEGSCALGFCPKNFAEYGADTEQQGKSKCGQYTHIGFDW